MTRCRACGAPIRYADRRRRFPLDPGGANHVCTFRKIERIPCDYNDTAGVRGGSYYRLEEYRVREQRKGRET